AAAMALGAQGAVMGTAFIATHESFAHAYHKQRIVEAHEGDTLLTDIFHINWPRGQLMWKMSVSSVSPSCASTMRCL
ncbi:nitronate monooxygenase, partial [Burkholderia cenocepacia]|uniref:nitronate monooxygenase n=1 Tax=Burkholderia cenocepacia TaxID=95486 RepID=UPI0024B6675B